MCGICGFAGRGSPEDLVRMNETLTHRGPDEDGFWHNRDEGVYLGHKRLSIIDIEGGAQPMAAENGRYHIDWDAPITA